VHAGGLLLAVVGLLLALRSALVLVGRGRPRRGPRPALVLAGPYLRMRNPLLAGVLLAVAGTALAVGSWLLVGLALALAVGAHLWVVRREEPRLRARFGAAYAAYMAHVPRWVPRFAGARAGDERDAAGVRRASDRPNR
jgi:protein-S-isoprenylcysteine O-methyltransferase Ste14